MNNMYINEINRIKGLMLINENIPGTRNILMLLDAFFPKLVTKEGDVQFLKALSSAKNADELAELISKKIKDSGIENITDKEIQDFVAILKKDSDELITAMKSGKSTLDDFARIIDDADPTAGFSKPNKRIFTKVVNALDDAKVATFEKETKENIVRSAIESEDPSIMSWYNEFKKRGLDYAKATEKRSDGITDIDDFANPEAIKNNIDQNQIFQDWPEIYNVFSEFFKKDADILKYFKDSKVYPKRLMTKFYYDWVKKIFGVWAEKGEVFVRAIKNQSDEAIQKEWDDALEEVFNRYMSANSVEDWNFKWLRDKFLTLKRKSDSIKYSLLLEQLEQTAKKDLSGDDALKNKAIDEIFTKMKAHDSTEGLDFIFKNLDTVGGSEGVKKSIKDWFYNFKNPPKSETWLKQAGKFFLQGIKLALRKLFTGTTQTAQQYRIYLARKGYSTKGAIGIELRRLLIENVVFPALWGFLLYWFYAGGVPFGGFKKSLEDLTNQEYGAVKSNLWWTDYAWNQVTNLTPFNIENMIFNDVSDPDWKDMLRKYAFPLIPGQLDLGALLIFSGSESTEKEAGLWKIKNLRNNEITEFNDLKKVSDFVAEHKNETSMILSTKKVLYKGKVYQVEATDQDKLRIYNELEFRKNLSLNNLEQKFKEGTSKLRTLFKEADVKTAQLRLATLELKLQQSEGISVGTDIANTIRPYFLFMEGDDVIAYTKDFKKIIYHYPNFGDIYGLDENGNKYVEDNLAEFGKYVYKKCIGGEMIDKSTIIPVKENLSKTIKNLIKEMSEGKKFGDDNFKHWKDTFKFKKLDEKTGQLKDVKITSKMDEIMDRIDHFRKKYDEDDSFVRAVIDVFGTGIDVIQYTKGLAHLTEGIIPEGLLSVLSNLRESKELVTWTVKHYKDGNWELVKGNFNKQELLNVGKTKRERDERQKESENPAEGLKKKEEESMMILKRDEKEGLNGLPTKVKDKVKEKLRQGWTTETPFDFLSEFYTESEINSVFNEKIKIYKLKPSLEFFRSLAKNSAKINLKKGFCKSLKNAEIEHDISQREKNVLHNFISKCESKFGV